MEAKAVVDLILEEYPRTKFWVSFQCKVVLINFLITNNVASGMLFNPSMLLEFSKKKFLSIFN